MNNPIDNILQLIPVALLIFWALSQVLGRGQQPPARPGRLPDLPAPGPGRPGAGGADPFATVRRLKEQELARAQAEARRRQQQQQQQSGSGPAMPQDGILILTDDNRSNTRGASSRTRRAAKRERAASVKATPKKATSTLLGGDLAQLKQSDLSHTIKSIDLDVEQADPGARLVRSAPLAVRIRRNLKNTELVRQAYIMSEVLGPPVTLREPR